MDPDLLPPLIERLMDKETVRNLLLEAGRKTFLERGFNNAGIEGILRTTGIPKGSFYYYFGSKEEFGLEVLERFGQCQTSHLERFLSDETYPAFERIRRYFESSLNCLESRGFREGCLVGNLSQEMSDHSEAFRERLEKIFAGWVDRFTRCLEQSQADGDLEIEREPREVAEFWLNSWQGAMLRAKTMRSAAPLRTFMDVMFGQVSRVKVS